MTILRIRDETASGEAYHELPLEFLKERITVRELIRERVRQEVHSFNLRQGERTFRGLVQPTDAERVLNGKIVEYKLKAHRPIDWEEQFARAIEAFGRNGFFILIDDRQAEDLDQELSIAPKTRVTFVKLVPLVGG
jgi:hypothetical protein